MTKFEPCVTKNGTKLDIAYFQKNLKIENGCWFRENKKKYLNVYNKNSVMLYLPKYLYQLKYGAIKNNLKNTCGNPYCVNPDHHELMLKIDNIDKCSDLRPLIVDYNRLAKDFDSFDDLFEYITKNKTSIIEDDCFYLLSRNNTKVRYLKYIQNGKRHTISISRLIYTLKYGHINDNITIKHICGHPDCINPDHIEETEFSKLRKYMDQCGLDKLKKGNLSRKNIKNLKLADSNLATFVRLYCKK